MPSYAAYPNSRIRAAHPHKHDPGRPPLLSECKRLHITRNLLVNYSTLIASTGHALVHFLHPVHFSSSTTASPSSFSDGSFRALLDAFSATQAFLLVDDRWHQLAYRKGRACEKAESCQNCKQFHVLHIICLQSGTFGVELSYNRHFSHFMKAATLSKGLNINPYNYYD